MSSTLSRTFSSITLMVFLLTSLSLAQVPKTISYQGILTDTMGTVVPDGNYSLTLKLYDVGTGGTPLWTEGQLVAVSKGIFSVIIGSAAPLNLPFDRTYWLGLTVESEPELTPRMQLTSAAYSLRAANTDSINGITAGGDLTGTYPNPTIGTGKVTTAKIADQAVTQAKLDPGVSLPPGGAAGGDLTGTYPNPTIANNAVTSTKILDGTIQAGDLAFSPGDITGVTAGTGLSGGGASGDVTLNVSVPLSLSGSSDDFNSIISGTNSGTGRGVSGSSTHSFGVYGFSSGSYGVLGQSSSSSGVYGSSSGNWSPGVYGYSTSGGIGVYGWSNSGDGVYGSSNGSYAGYFLGNVNVTGTLSKGGGSFKIDHPLDPANKYLYHSFVESPDMMNIYNGNVITDANGEAVVELPEWFEALNRDFRYQLTVIGQFAQAIVSEKVHNNRFTIKTDKPNVEVSWQVTGIRHDAFAEAHRIQVEVEKTGAERGKYIHPKEHGVSETLGIDYEKTHAMEEQRKAEQEKMKAMEEQQRLEREKK